MQKYIKNKIILIDNEDEEIFNKYTWCIHNGYLVTNIKKDKKYKTVYFHRLLLNPEKIKQIDHKNGNRLDNRKQNLRICTAKQNKQHKTKIFTKSGYKGVYKNYKKWISRITVNNKTIYLGSFENKILAAKAYDKAAKKYFKKFAFTNFNYEI